MFCLSFFKRRKDDGRRPKDGESSRSNRSVGGKGDYERVPTSHREKEKRGDRGRERERGKDRSRDEAGEDKRRSKRRRHDANEEDEDNASDGRDGARKGSKKSRRSRVGGEEESKVDKGYRHERKDKRRKDRDR